MIEQAKNCQNCKKDFTIEPDDFSFYEKIKVPPPTFCPECRMIRRMTWRNERSLFKRTCDFNGKSIITMFHPDVNIKVYDRDIWWSDKWDPNDYGMDYDFDKPFFEQYSELFTQVPFPSLYNGKCVNSMYSNHVGEIKNAYLTFASWIGENIYFSSQCGTCTNIFDVALGNNTELSYEIVSGKKLYKVFYSQNCENCIDSSFLFDCKNCQNCFACFGLRNKNYCIWNKQYSRDEYLLILNKINLGSYDEVNNYKKLFREFKINNIHKYANIINSQKVTGDNITESFNCKKCFDIWDEVKDCKYMVNGGMKANDSYDSYGFGVLTDLQYETVDSGDKASRLLGTIVAWNCLNVFYSVNCHGCNNLFGCIGLRKKQYCILNRQYTKEQYEELVPKIIQHMNDMPYIDSKGRVYKYGEFFPSELSPFCYNETIAQEYFPLTKEQAQDQGYKWKDKEERNYTIDIHTEDIVDNINEVNDDITTKIIECAHKGTCNKQCTEAFKIIPEELSFYRRMNLSLPRLCPNCRHYERLSQRNPMKLWHRKCMHEGCTNEFETSYSPERKEIVYCERCYQQEVI
jgi:hypothetical protein